MGVVLCRKARPDRSPRRANPLGWAVANPEAASRNPNRVRFADAAVVIANPVETLVGSATVPTGMTLTMTLRNANANANVNANAKTAQSRKNAASPVPGIVLNDAPGYTDFHAHEVTPLELATYQLATTYDALVTAGAWDARFRRGRRPSSPNGVVLAKRKLEEDDDAVRSLATTYLAHAATDAWNVVAGAVELARVWAFRPARDDYDNDKDQRLPTLPSAKYKHVTDTLDRDLRLRLAVCLFVSWKFARSCQTALPRMFAPGDGTVVPRTLELAFAAYSFLLPHEQDVIGDWEHSNIVALRKLQANVLALELELVIGVHTFPLLAENAQTAAELHIQHLFETEQVSETRCMQMRGLIPFFVRTALFKSKGESTSLYADLLVGADLQTGARALVCAAWMSIKHAGYPARDMRIAKMLFAPEDYLNAWKLLDNATRATSINPAFYNRGCYGDEFWYGHRYVLKSTLTNAMIACMPGMDPDAHRLAHKASNLGPVAAVGSAAAAGLFSYVTKGCLW